MPRGGPGWGAPLSLGSAPDMGDAIGATDNMRKNKGSTNGTNGIWTNGSNGIYFHLRRLMSHVRG